MGESKFFVDTNVLLYSLDPADPRKQARAAQWMSALWAGSSGRLSWQVLHEFYANVSRKFRPELKKGRDVVETLSLWRPGEMTFGLIERGWYWMDAAQLSYWDSLILASAERQGCEWLLSEDFQTARRYGQVTVVNPFLKSPADFGFETVPPQSH
jgi:predicted nucleic acid-binding protein